MTNPHVAEIFERLSKGNPSPTTELNYTSPYTLLVAVALSAQATDVGVNKATENLFKVVRTPHDLLALGEEGLLPYIKSIGLYRSKAKNLIKAAQRLVALYNGEVPACREALESLPGVGRKTANVILNTAFGLSTIAVDTHIFRVSHRLDLSQGKTPQAVEEDLMQCVPSMYLQNCHHWLLLHGRYICKARTPLCAQCILQDICPYPHKSS